MDEPGGAGMQLGAELVRAIGREGAGMHILIGEAAGDVAIDGGGRGVDDRYAPGIARGFEDGNGATHVRAMGGAPCLVGPRDGGDGGEVEAARNAVQEFPHAGGIGDVADDQFAVRIEIVVFAG